MFNGSTTSELQARGSNWRSHVHGAIKLIELRGPRRCANKEAHLLFVDTRIAAVRIISPKGRLLSSCSWAPDSVCDHFAEAKLLCRTAVAIAAFRHRTEGSVG